MAHVRKGNRAMKPALLIVDMLKDTFEGHPETELQAAARHTKER